MLWCMSNLTTHTHSNLTSLWFLLLTLTKKSTTLFFFKKSWFAPHLVYRLTCEHTHSISWWQLSLECQMVNCESFRGVVKFEEDWRLKCRLVFFWVTNECVSIHFPTCLRGNFCLLYCLIPLQALNCCPQEDAKRYNRNSFVLSRPSSENLFFSFFLVFASDWRFLFFLAAWCSSIRWFAFFQCYHLLLLYFLSFVCLVSCAFFITTISFCVFCSLWWLGLLECHSGLKPTDFTPVLIQIKTYFWSI